MPTFENVKSVVIDIADNWGNATLIGIRSIEFKYNSSLIALSVSDFTVYKTSRYTYKYEAENVFNTSLSKTGSAMYTQWYSSSATNQRLIIVFNSVKTFDEIVINNGHNGGLYATDAGAKNVKFQITEDTLTSDDNVYDAAVSNGVLIFDGQIDEHIASDTADDQILTLLSPTPDEWTGGDVTFTTLSAGPTVSTDPATGVKSNSATLNGNLDDLQDKGFGQVSFVYGVDDSTDTYPNETSVQIVYTDGSLGAFDEVITGLIPSTDYHFKAKLSIPGLSTVYGDEETFTTLAPAQVSTDAETNVTINGATLHGTVDELSDYDYLWCSFIYGVDDSADTYPMETNLQKITGEGSVGGFQINVSGLTPSENYHYKAKAYYPGGTAVYGAEETFTTLSDATVTTGAADTDLSQGDTYAELHGNLTSLGTGVSSVDVWMGIGIKNAQGEYQSIQYSTPETKTSTGTFSAVFSNLIPGQLYYYVAFASDNGYIVYGDVLSFTAGTAIVETDPATSVDTDSAILNGTLLSLNEVLNSSVTMDVYFEYGPNFVYSTAPEELGSVGSAGAFDATVTGLDSNTEYQFRAVADNGSELFYGETETFITSIGIEARTGVPSNLTQTGCKFIGYANTDREVQYYFEYGITSSFGKTTTKRYTSSTGEVEEYITGLTLDTEYYVRLVLVDEISTSPGITYNGNTIIFKTAPEIVEPDRAVSVSWLFDIMSPYPDETVYYRWSTKDVTFGGNSYTAKIIPQSFAGINENLNLGTNLISPVDLELEIENADNSFGVPDNPMTKSSLEDNALRVRLVIDGTVTKTWRYYIESLTYHYGTVRLYCASLFQIAMRKDWPNNNHPKEVWPSSDEDHTPNYCIPEIFGTVFIPLMRAYIDSDSYYVLGNNGTYTITKVISPTDADELETFQSGSYSFTQTTKDGYKVAQFLIAGSSLNNGLWKKSGHFLMPRVQYSKSATVNVTNPADIIEWIIKDLGVAASWIDTGASSSFGNSKLKYAIQNLVWNAGFYQKAPAEQVIASLLNMCDSFLYDGDSLQLYQFSRSSVEMFDRTKVMDKSFRIRANRPSAYDGGRVSWPNADSPQEYFPGMAVVPTDASNTDVENPDRSVFQYKYQFSSVNAQIAGILYFQKKNDKKETVSFTTSLAAIQDFNNLLPGKVITLYDEGIFKMTLGVFITRMFFQRDGRVKIEGTELNNMNEWNDLNPTAVTIVEDTTEGNM